MNTVNRGEAIDGTDTERSEAEAFLNRLAGQKLRKLRKENGVTQTALGATINVSQQQVRKYESGKSRMSIGQAYLLAQAAGGNITDLLPEDMEFDVSNTHTLVRELLNISEQISTEDRGLLLQLAKRFPLPRNKGV